MMRIVLLIALLLSIQSALLAQVDSLYLSTEVENEIYSLDFANSQKRLYDFLTENNIKVQNQKEGKTDLMIKLVLTQQQYKKYELLVAAIGYSTSKKVNTNNNYGKVNEINLELSYLKQKRNSYAEVLKKIDEKSSSYLSLWNDQQVLEEKIFNKERELINLNNKENTFFVSLKLNDEAISPENGKVSFINMPGLEYSVLNIETPKSGISAPSYQGYLLKYLFTKGKSYATLGAYKSKNIGQADSTAYSDLFVLGFGQDFYSRHLGRGSRKFLNLYSGYTIGGLLASGKSNKSNMFYVFPSLGLELFKNEYILIDTKMNYFLPLSDNRYLRGFSYSVSFNFVF